MPGRFSRRAVAIPAGLAVAFSLTAPVVAAPSPNPDVAELSAAVKKTSPSPSAKIVSPLEKGRVTAFVQVAAPSVVTASDDGVAPSTAKKRVEAMTSAVADAIADPKATVMYTTTNAISGFAVEADAEALTKLAQREDVIAIRPLTLRTPSNGGTNQLTKALQAWKYSGATGKDVTIAVIDSGVDFTHTTFGGSGDYSPYRDAAARTAKPTWPIGNVIGGWDFVGEDYSPSGSLGSRVAVPDPNPIDIAPEVCTADPKIRRSGGHGTHVAGTAAGKGVNADGTTFTGEYAALSDEDLAGFQVAPGSAPEANILAFKVFGCAGSTGYVPAALDELLAKNDDGSYKWPKVDIVNMSLGGTYAPAGDPENLIVDALFKERGIVSVVASGNDGDQYDIGGSPGNAASALTVANSTNGVSYFDAATFDLGGTEEKLAGQYSVSYEWTSEAVGPKEVVALTGDNSEACEPLSAEDVEKVKDKAALIDWVEAPSLKCGSAARFNNLEAAGAAGVVLKSSVNEFTSGIAGNKALPGFQLTADNTAKVEAALAAGPVSVTFTKDGISAIREFDANNADKLNSSSSRGVHGSFGIVKPDVAAPGTQIVSAAVGSGNGPTAMTGTSMATPHVAGVTALVKQAHPKWNAIQLKAGVMNTAFHDITSDKGAYGPQRVGAGRVDAKAGVDNHIVMFDSQASALASVNFGIVEFPAAGFTADRKVTIQNTGDKAAALKLSYLEATKVPGVTYSVSPAAVNVPAGGQVEATVTIAIDPKRFAKVIDPTMPLEQEVAALGGAKFLREFISTPTGRLVAKGTGAPEGGELRLPISATVKPASALTAKSDFDADKNTGTLSATGETFAHDSAYPGRVNAFVPVALPLEFVASSPEKKVSAEEEPYAEVLKSTDIKRVGVLSNVKQLTGTPEEIAKEAQVLVGLETYAAWPISPAAPGYLSLKVQAKGKTYSVQAMRLEGSDVAVVAVFDDAGKNTGLSFVNQVPGGAFDTNTFDSAVMALPFELTAVGFTPEEIAAGDLPLTITAVGNSWYAAEKPDEGLAAGETDAVAFEYNAGKPRISFASNLGVKGVDLNLDGEAIAYTLDPDAKRPVAKNAQEGDDKHDVLYFHLHNKVGEQAELLALKAATEPTETPTETPTEEPTEEPTETPTEEPTEEPTETPTEEPTETPTETPTEEPTETPTQSPTDEPTAKPTNPGKPGLPITGGEVLGAGFLALVLLGGGALLIRRRTA